LIKIPYPAKKANSNFMHNQILSPLLDRSRISPTDYFETTVFEARAKRNEIIRKTYNNQKA
jgi:hypothetical protein